MYIYIYYTHNQPVCAQDTHARAQMPTHTANLVDFFEGIHICIYVYVYM